MARKSHITKSVRKPQKHYRIWQDDAVWLNKIHIKEWQHTSATGISQLCAVRIAMTSVIMIRDQEEIKLNRMIMWRRFPLQNGWHKYFFRLWSAFNFFQSDVMIVDSSAKYLCKLSYLYDWHFMVWNYRVICDIFTKFSVTFNRLNTFYCVYFKIIEIFFPYKYKYIYLIWKEKIDQGCWNTEQ